ncbi:MBL fold metallo-hydrolase [Candidatus Bathyarchaeota archaeon]|nr:MBL fold metallo-hydrolase [Candidatus Bathyarchaeota archaeon]
MSVKDITVAPLAFESLGVRSMSSLIKTPDLSILVDPGLSLGIRFNLLPHPEEYRTRAQLRRRLIDESRKADVVTVSHYHHDHYTPNYTENVLIGSTPEEAQEIIQDKTLLLKDFRTKINPSQRRRGWLFNRFAEKFSRRIHIADGNRFQFGATELKFSHPVFHGGSGSGLGWVVMLTVIYGEDKITHTSDVQGPMDEAVVGTILSDEPRILVLCGPPLYLSGRLVKEEQIELARANLTKLSQEVSTVILDHHLMRSPDWRDFIEPALQAAELNRNTIRSAAEHAQLPNRLLECRRRELYSENPPCREFLKWTKLPEERRRLEPPPI